MVLQLKDINFSFFSVMDSSDSMQYPELLQSCPWPKDLPFRPPEDSICSQPGSIIGDTEDHALKGMSHLRMVLLWIFILYLFSAVFLFSDF